MFHDENRVTGSKAYKQKMPRKTVDYFLVRHMSKFLQMVVTYYLPVTLLTYYLLITTITYLLNVSSNYKSLVHPTRHSYQFSVKKKVPEEKLRGAAKLLSNTEEGSQREAIKPVPFGYKWDSGL